MTTVPSNNASLKQSPIEGSVVQSIVLVDQVTRSDAADCFVSTSLPGHLLQLVVKGEIEQEVSGRIQRVGPGMAIWYYENEPVQGRILRKPWTFLTVNFFAARLPPPPFEQRVWSVGKKAFVRFRELLAIWRDREMPPLVRHLRAFETLMQLLLEVLHPETLGRRSDLPAQPWWDIETKLHEDFSQAIDLKTLKSLSRHSSRQITRACELATGSSPMRRVKELRMSYARGLVLYSQISITEIAMRVGYGRVQEFSRDYRNCFSVSPREDRKSGPDYQIQQPPNDYGRAKK